jgi:hypothetical protein
MQTLSKDVNYPAENFKNYPLVLFLQIVLTYYRNLPTIWRSLHFDGTTTTATSRTPPPQTKRMDINNVLIEKNATKSQPNWSRSQQYCHHCQRSGILRQQLQPLHLGVVLPGALGKGGPLDQQREVLAHQVDPVHQPLSLNTGPLILASPRP